MHELWLGASAAQISTKGGPLTPPAATLQYKINSNGEAVSADMSMLYVSEVTM